MRNLVLPALVAMGVFVPEVKRDVRMETVTPVNREDRQKTSGRTDSETSG